MGDFNVPLDPVVDISKPIHDRNDAEALLQWTLHLGRIDAWRTTHSTSKEYTGPGRRSRIDYGCLSSVLFHDSLTSIRHDHTSKYQRADHLPIIFRLQHPDFPKQSILSWECPPWIFKVPEIEHTLKASLYAFKSHLRNGPFENSGAIYDEHKRDDLRYLRYMFRLIMTKRTEETQQARYRLHTLKQDKAANPSQFMIGR
ncbi:hypothetical protein ABG067_007554 [Albugo candida]